MQKNIILIVAGAGDFFFGSDSTKVIKNKEALLDTLKTLVNKNNYKSKILCIMFSLFLKRYLFIWTRRRVG